MYLNLSFNVGKLGDYKYVTLIIIFRTSLFAYNL